MAGRGRRREGGGRASPCTGCSNRFSPAAGMEERRSPAVPSFLAEPGLPAVPAAGGGRAGGGGRSADSWLAPVLWRRWLAAGEADPSGWVCDARASRLSLSPSPASAQRSMEACVSNFFFFA